MYKYFKFSPKEINDFFKEEDIYKYCKSCNAKVLKTTKFCMECGSKEFYPDYKSFLMATTKYCTVCLSKVIGNRCSCGSTDLTSADKAFAKLSEKYVNKGVASINEAKDELANYEAKEKSKEAELKTITKKIENLIQMHKDYLKELDLIEQNKEKELDKYQIKIKENKGKSNTFSFSSVQGQKIILETKQELLMEAINDLDKLSGRAQALKFIEDIYSQRFTYLKTGDNFKENVFEVDDDYKEGKKHLERRFAGYTSSASKCFEKAEKAKHPGAIQEMANIELTSHHDYVKYLVKHLQALDLLSILMQYSSRKDSGIIDNIISNFLNNFAILSFTEEESDTGYFQEIAKQYEDSAKQYANSPTQTLKKGR